MCVVSMVGDQFSRTIPYWPQIVPGSAPQVIQLKPDITRAEFDALRQRVEELHALLRAAKRYDAEHGEPDCSMEQKVWLLRSLAHLVGISLEDVLPAPDARSTPPP